MIPDPAGEEFPCYVCRIASDFEDKDKMLPGQTRWKPGDRYHIDEYDENFRPEDYKDAVELIHELRSIDPAVHRAITTTRQMAMQLIRLDRE